MGARRPHDPHPSPPPHPQVGGLAFQAGAPLLWADWVSKLAWVRRPSDQGRAAGAPDSDAPLRESV